MNVTKGNFCVVCCIWDTGIAASDGQIRLQSHYNTFLAKRKTRVMLHYTTNTLCVYNA